jgi:phenylpyruvate tautomerase PptA (4-oxalocrotonate tautomerase family)
VSPIPLVRIDLIENRWTADRLASLTDAVQDVMIDEFAVPKRDRYQIITEHKPGHIIALDTDLGFERSDDVVIISITHQGRTTAQKQAIYRELAARLKDAVNLQPEDLIVNVVENTKADWTFGFGRAQFLEGDL